MSVLALIIAVLPVFVNAKTTIAAGITPSEASALIARITKAGVPNKISAGRSRFLNIPAGTPVKFEEILANQTSDGLDRSCELVFESSETVRPSCLLVRVSKDNLDAKKSESHYFQLSPTGSLQRIILSIVKLDNDGKVIRGSGSIEDKPASPELMKMLRTELDFWLKGKHRKKSLAKPAAKK